MNAKGFREILLIVLPLLWAGILLGASFLGTLAKFQAPSITLPIALDVGRQTFSMLLQIELILAVVTIFLTCFPRIRREALIGLGLVGIVVTTQSIWLRPILDVRVERFLQGEEPPISFHHTLYAALEALKVVVLTVVSIRAMLQR